MRQWLAWWRRILLLLRIKPGQPAGRLLLLFLISGLVTLFMATGSATADRLFQSPQSPESPLEVAPEPAVPEPAVPPEEEAPALDPLGMGTEEQTGEEVAPEAPLPAVSAPEQPLPAPQPVRRSRDEAAPAEKSGGPGNFILDQAELIDSMIVSGAYVWVCCGIGLMLLAPFFLLVLEIRGRSKLRRRD